MIIKMNSLIIKVKLSEAQITNEYFLEEDEKILKLSFNSENNEKSNNKKVIIFNKKENYKLVRTLKDILLTSSSSEVDVEIAFHIQLPVRTNDQHQADKRDSERVFLVILQEDFLRISLDLDQHSKHLFVHEQKQTCCEICSQKTEDQDERLEDFDMKKIILIFNEIFAAEQQFKIHK